MSLFRMNLSEMFETGRMARRSGTDQVLIMKD
jgi:hypothetical protein